MVYTADLVEQRFDAAHDYAAEALTNTNTYMAELTTLFESLTQPDIDALEDVAIGTDLSINYDSIPDFTSVISTFPTFNNITLNDISLDAVPDVDGNMPVKNFNFISNTVSKPTINYPTPPEEPTLESLTFPELRDFTIPDLPDLLEFTVPAAPIIDIAKFSATAPLLEILPEPVNFTYTEGAYNSDIRVALFNKILNDILNGGTGLDVTVEADLWARYQARQIAENNDLYQKVEDKFSGVGFSLPSGAHAAAKQQVYNEISIKNDLASWNIAIAQGELAQKNTLFSVEQAVILEKMLVDFFQAQENRSLQAQQILAANAIELYNAMVTRQTLLLEKYKAESAVFADKIKAELYVAEIYKTQVEAAKATADVNNARINLYNAQIGAIELFVKIYQVEMDAVRIRAEIQNLQLGIFKTKTEAYIGQLNGEKVKAEIYAAEVDAEGVRADAFKAEVQAYSAEVQAALGVLEASKMKAENKLKTNQLKIEEYKARLGKFQYQIESEIKVADLAVKGHAISAETYRANTAAKEMEFRVQLQEFTAQLGVVQAKLEKAKALVDSETNSYVALKKLIADGTEGIMNVNAQLASAAMNAVNASASQAISSSTTESTSNIHTYDHGSVTD